MRRILTLLLLALPMMLMAKADRIEIIFENDAHSTLPGYARMATIKAAASKEVKNVLTVSGGDFTVDFMSRNTLGTKSKGAGIIEIMNSIGYDYIVPGNHDFDFSVQTMQENMSALKATVVCCNLQNINDGSTLFPGYSIRKIGGKKIAFVGVTTPKAISSRNKALFSDADGNLLYTFCEETLCDIVQSNVDKARSEGADYVIVLSHLGDKQNGSVTSLDLIAATTGIDVVLDAHAHTVIPEQRVADKSGKEVILSSTGLKFANIGILSIEKDGTMSTTLVPTDGIEPDAATMELIDSLNKKYGME